MEKSQLDNYLRTLIEKKGSDLHIKSGSVSHIRVEGELYPIDEEPVMNKDIEKLAQTILPKKHYDRLVTDKELDYSYVLDEHNRFRTNFFYQLNGLSIAMRAIPIEIPTIPSLNLPKSIEKLADEKSGLILVTGPAGSGKSTTIASLINIVNKKYRKHIITIEDPIEFIFKESKSIVTQRAIGENTHSFKRALRASFREDFDVILIGEIRDYETMEIALQAANTGHLVLSTIHTKGSVETISKIINMFPPDEHEQIKNTLSEVLVSIISQRLVKTKKDKLIPAVGILKNTARIAELISQGRDNEIMDAIERGKNVYEMQSMDQSLSAYYKKGFITKEVMLANANSPSDLKLITEGVVR